MFLYMNKESLKGVENGLTQWRDDLVFKDFRGATITAVPSGSDLLP